MNIETKRCRNIRRVLVALFIVCGYLLSTTYAVDYMEINGEETYVPMTALNLAFGTMGSDIPVRQNTVIGIVYLALPLIGFFFMFFDKKSNIKNFVGIGCGVIGMMSILMFIGGNIGMGALVSIFCYMLITILSATAVLMNLQDRKSERSAPTLKKHTD